MALIPNGETTEAPSVEATKEEAITTGTEQEKSIEHKFMYDDETGGKGEIPDWFKPNKYKTVSEQARGYSELETKFGSFSGSPKDGYKVEGVDIEDSPLLKATAKWGMENQMSNKGMESLIKVVNELATAQIEEDSTANRKALGDKADERLNTLSQWGKNNLSEDEFVQFQGLAQTAGQVEVIEKIVAMSKNSKLVDVEAQARSTEDIEETLNKMQFAKDDKGKFLIDTDPAYRAKFLSQMNQQHNK